MFLCTLTIITLVLFQLPEGYTAQHNVMFIVSSGKYTTSNMCIMTNHKRQIGDENHVWIVFSLYYIQLFITMCSAVSITFMLKVKM